MQEIQTAPVVAEKTGIVTRARKYVSAALLTVAFVVAGPVVAANASTTPTLGTVTDDFRAEITTNFLTYVLPGVFILGALTVGASLAWKWMRRAAKSS